MHTFLARVADRREEAQGICSFDLVAADGEPALPAFTPGAHIDVHVPGGWVRQYSLCNDSARRDFYRIGVLRADAGRGGSRAMQDQVRIGTVLRIGAPRNLFPLHGSGEHSLLLAGGIGITPLLCMAQALVREGRSFDLHYSARTAARAAFIDALQTAPLDRHVHLHFDDGPPSSRLDIDALLRRQVAGTHLYVCGPAGFMAAVLDTARQLHWPAERLHHEFFSPPAQETPTGARPFRLRLARSGQVVDVAADQSATTALAAAGVSVSTSCEQGICGTCITPVLAGVPEHKDSFLMPHEQAGNDRFAPCCSRSLTPELVLDL